MDSTVEITGFIIRVGPDVLTPPKYLYECAVYCMVSDGKHAVIKALSPEGKFTEEHALAILARIKERGLIPMWWRAGKSGPIIADKRAAG